jgi:hypothetical protein
MKKLNTSNKLAFNKAVVTELNEDSLKEVNGGAPINTISSGFCSGCFCQTISRTSIILVEI